MQECINAMREINCIKIRATIHPVGHVYMMVPEDAICDENILADCQFAALGSGARLYKIVLSHKRALPIERLMEKLAAARGQRA